MPDLVIRNLTTTDEPLFLQMQIQAFKGLEYLRVKRDSMEHTRFPEFRKQGIGSALMNATIREAKKRNQNTMRVYTLAFLDHLAPGAVLYLKTGARIEGEYLQLQKRG